MEHKALGKGLSALIPKMSSSIEEKEAIIRIPIGNIKPNRFQPRTVFVEENLIELANSIREQGVVQPILVTTTNNPNVYELIAGERRWRASKIAGIKEIPAIVRQVTSSEQLMVSLIENLQRENLNPLEEAEAYKELMSKFDFTQESLAKQVGKARSVIANTLRLLNLPEEVKNAVSKGIIQSGHARALLGLSDENQINSLASRIVSEKLTVRETESIIQGIKIESGKKLRTKSRRVPELIQAEEMLQRVLGTKVRIQGNSHRGKISIFYFSLNDLERFVHHWKQIKIKK